MTLSQVCSIPLYLLGLHTLARAEIIPDDSLDTESSVVTPNVNIKSIPSEQIDGGASRGVNLFHSFREFNIGEGQGAYFTNPAGIENILSRVTGISPSNILGTLGVLGNANLFLINPNGIVFGPKARLDVGGSLVASTASTFKFADGTEFSATNPSTSPLLTISVPIGLQYRSNAVGIQVQGSSLNLPNGETLALVGGDLSLDGANLRVLGGQVELGGLAGAGTIGLNLDGNNLRLSFPDDVARADVSLTNGAGVNVAAGGGGRIVVNARNLDLVEGSSLSAGIASKKGSPQSRAGDIEINATGTINLDGSFIATVVSDGATGKGGDINITTGSLFVTNGARMSASTLGQGDAGSVNIRAERTVSFKGVSSNGFFSGAFSNVASGAVGNSGSVNITSGSLSVSNGAVLGVSTFGQGDAGSVNIHAESTVSFDGVSRNRFSSGVDSRVEREGVGNGGNINITTGSLSVSNGARLTASTLGRGDAGSVNIHAGSTVSFQGVGRNGYSSGAFSTVASGAVGNGGSVNITTGLLSVSDAAVVGATTTGQGNGGDITLNINTLEALNGGQVLTTSRSSGKAGNITVNANDSITLSGSNPTYFDRFAQFGGNRVLNAGPASGLFANTTKDSTGQGGDLMVNTGQLLVKDGAQVTASNLGLGNAGNIKVEANSIHLDNQAIFSADTRSLSSDSSQANITLRSQDLVLRRSSQITTNARGSANGGNITIDTGVLAALEDSDISANAEERSGGRVTVNAQGIFGTQFRLQDTPKSDITATGGSPELSGTVEINRLGVDPSRGLVTLPVNVVDRTAFIAQNPCERGKGSSFVVTGRGGLAPNPSDALSNDAVRVNLVEPASLVRTEEQGQTTEPDTHSIQNPKSKIQNRIVPAVGWVFNNKGEVVLTAYEPTSTFPQRPWVNSADCRVP